MQVSSLRKTESSPMNEITISGSAAVGEVSFPPEQNPFHVYLARLATGSRPAMRGALETLAALASSGQVTAEAFPCVDAHAKT